MCGLSQLSDLASALNVYIRSFDEADVPIPSPSTLATLETVLDAIQVEIRDLTTTTKALKDKRLGLQLLQSIVKRLRLSVANAQRLFAVLRLEQSLQIQYM